MSGEEIITLTVVSLPLVSKSCPLKLFLRCKSFVGIVSYGELSEIFDHVCRFACPRLLTKTCEAAN